MRAFWDGGLGLHTITEETTTDPKKDHLSHDDPVADRIPDQVRHCMAVRP
jgi:hypothetical protein